MGDHVEELRRLARLDWPEEVALLVGTLTPEEWERLGELLRRSEGPITREAVRGCLDAHPTGRGDGMSGLRLSNPKSRREVAQRLRKEEKRKLRLERRAAKRRRAGASEVAGARAETEGPGPREFSGNCAAVILSEVQP